VRAADSGRVDGVLSRQGWEVTGGADGYRTYDCATCGLTWRKSRTTTPVLRDDGSEIAIDSMPMRAKYEPFVRGEGDSDA
jgi:hypothetical protein